MFAIEVNGNRLHDEGAHDGAMRVTREGGGPLEFSTLAEAEAHADAVFARLQADAGLRRVTLARDRYVVVDLSPAEPAPIEAPEPAAPLEGEPPAPAVDPDAPPPASEPETRAARRKGRGAE